jgi:hypothetical protein
MGVARESLGGGGRADCCGGRPDMALFMGLTFGDGGMARPSLGVRVPVPLLCRPPGNGGRSKGAGEDMFGRELFDVPDAFGAIGGFWRC